MKRCCYLLKRGVFPSTLNTYVLIMHPTQPQHLMSIRCQMPLHHIRGVGSVDLLTLSWFPEPRALQHMDSAIVSSRLA